MASFCKVILIGNLTRDPELKYSAKGTAITEVGMAINRQWTTEAGEKMSETTFVDITLFGRAGEIVSQYCQKGAPLMVEGRLQTDSWEDKATMQKRTKLKVVGENIQLLGSKPEAGPAPGRAEREQQRPAPSGQRAPAPVDKRQQAPPPARQAQDDFGEGPITEGLDDDEIPFNSPVALQA